MSAESLDSRKPEVLSQESTFKSSQPSVFSQDSSAKNLNMLLPTQLLTSCLEVFGVRPTDIRDAVFMLALHCICLKRVLCVSIFV